jgi:hypothetical protein
MPSIWLLREWLIAILIKPFAVLALFALVIPIEIALRPYLPPAFTDRTFASREPLKYMAVWIALVMALWFGISYSFIAAGL